MIYFINSLLLILSINAFGQNTEYQNIAEISGLLLVENSKEKISQNKIPIDKINRMLFIPFNKDTSISIKRYLKTGINTEFYVFYPYQSEIVFFHYDSALLSRLENENLLVKYSELENGTQKYYLKGIRENKVYSIFYLKGEWLEIKYDLWSNKLSSNFMIEFINLDARMIRLYYLIHPIDFYEFENHKIKGVRRVR